MSRPKVCPECGFRQFAAHVTVPVMFDGRRVNGLLEDPRIDGKDNVSCLECGWEGQVRSLMERPRVLALDVDGTLLEYTGSSDFGDPVPGMVRELKKLRDLGWKIALWTVRNPDDSLRNHLASFDVPYDFLNENPFGPPNQSRKMYADVYLDDKAMRFTGDAAGLADRVTAFKAWHKERDK